MGPELGNGGTGIRPTSRSVARAGPPGSGLTVRAPHQVHNDAVGDTPAATRQPDRVGVVFEQFEGDEVLGPTSGEVVEGMTGLLVKTRPDHARGAAELCGRGLAGGVLGRQLFTLERGR